MPAFNYDISVTGDCTSQGLGAITLFLTGGTPPYSVEWITPYVGSTVDTIEPVTITNLFADTYIVRVNDSTLPDNSEFFINIPVSNGVCAGILSVTPVTCGESNGVVITTSTSLFSSTEFSLYNSDDELLSTVITNTSDVEFANLSAGTYYIVAEDLGGCTGKTQDFIIEKTTPLDYGLYIVPNASCGTTPMGKIYITGLTGTPPFEYLWSNSQTGDTISGLTSGNYFVTVTDGYGCTLTKPAVVEDIDPIGLGAFSAISPSCLVNNGSVTIIITGGTEPYLYSASTGAFTISYSKFYTISGLYAGEYSFLVKDAAFCTLEAGVALASPTGITSVDLITQNSTCSSSDGLILTAVVGGTAPFTYTLVSASGTVNFTSSLQTFTFTGLSTGNYTVAVGDANGCGFVEEVSLIAEDKFTVTTEVTGTTCNLNNGVVGVYVSSGFTSPLDYSIDGLQVITDTSQTAVTFSNLSYGQHTLVVTDSDGCSHTKPIYINPSEPLMFSLYSTSCLNNQNGVITAFISYGTPPFTFDWSQNVTGNPQQITVSGLSADTYSVTIVDANGCSLTRQTIITCNKLYSSYQTYVMGEEVFNIESPTKCGIQNMFTGGFVDLTTGNTNCTLVSATFEAIVRLNPLGVENSQIFYTSTSLSSYPSDNEWYLTVKTLLYTLPGVGKVIIDNSTGKITVQTLPDSTIISGQELLVELKINYDIDCQS